MTDSTKLRQQCENRFGGLRTNRYSYWQHWQELASYILPRRYKWLVTPNQANRGSPINQLIIDSTGTLAARTLAAGFMAGSCSPTRPWFRLKIAGFEDSSTPVAIWLDECQRRMLHVFQESNFYNAMAVMFFDLVVFGTAAVLVYEDYDDVIRCYNPALGEYYLDNSNRLEVCIFYREFVMTIAQLVEEFGVEACSEDVKREWKTGGAGLTRERMVRHAVERNEGDFGGPPKLFPYREVYWEAGQGQNLTLRVKGYHELPGFFPRWDLVSNDPYGRAPGMDALGDIKQLQLETRRKAQAIDKMVNPPLIADVQLKNQPMSLLPGGTTYVSGLSRDRVGAAPLYTIQPPIGEMKQDIAEVQERVRRTFYNNLFTDIQDIQTVRSATEIDARREEKIVMLGPVLERVQNEAHAKAIDRVWGIMLRGGLLPPPPDMARGQAIQIEYVSMLAEAQRAVTTTAIERLFGFAGNLTAVFPEIIDNLDEDETIDIYGGLLNVPPKILRPTDQVVQRRAARAQQQRQAQAQQETTALVQGANVLSQTEVGGGQNALERMLGG